MFIFGLVVAAPFVFPGRARAHTAANPQIMNVNVANLTDTQATITWTSDPADTAMVRYGTVDTTDGRNLLAQDSSLANNHSLTLSNLNPSMTYYFRIVSTNGTIETGSYSFMTGSTSGGQNVTPTLVNSTTTGTPSTTTPSSGMATITVNEIGSGSGLTLGGVSGPLDSTASCDASTCTFSFPIGSTVTLSGAANSGSVFNGWSGCSAIDTSGNCQLTLNQNMAVYADFEMMNAAPAYVAPSTSNPSPSSTSSSASAAANQEMLDGQNFQQLTQQLQALWNTEEARHGTETTASDLDNQKVMQDLNNLIYQWQQETK